MLTIDDIKNVGFRRAKFGGYKPEDVDAFIDDVQISFEKMAREIRQLNDTVRNLNNQVKKFKEESQSIESVISSAQKVAEKSLDDAKVHTDSMISAAAKKSEDMINKAKKEVEINREISERLKSESAKLREKLDAIYKRHLEIIDEIPADVFAQSEKGAAGSTSYVKENEIKEVKSATDISKSVTSNIRKRFFEIDATIGKDVRGGLAAADPHKKDIFNLESVASKKGFDSELPKIKRDKFKNLQFGKNVNVIGEENNFSNGVYSGALRK